MHVLMYIPVHEARGIWKDRLLEHPHSPEYTQTKIKEEQIYVNEAKMQ